LLYYKPQNTILFTQHPLDIKSRFMRYPIPAASSEYLRPITFLASMLLAAMASAANIRTVSCDSPEPQRFETVGFRLDIDPVAGDPFDQRQIAVDLIATAPSGKILRVPGFFQHETDVKGWRVRFTPQEEGSYQLQFELRQQDEVVDQKSADPLLVAPSLKDGFLKPHDLWTWRYDSGRPFRGIGENVCWEGEWRGKYYSYDHMLAELSLNGANFYRTWMCYWNLPVEWKIVQPGGISENSESTFNESAVRRFDELIALNERLNLHMMLVIDWHGRS
jgi:hypothetical protein